MNKTYAVIAEEDENLVVIRRYCSETEADIIWHSLNHQYPNGFFDIVPSKDAEHIPDTETEW